MNESVDAGVLKCPMSGMVIDAQYTKDPSEGTVETGSVTEASVADSNSSKNKRNVGIQKKDKCNDEDDLTGFAPGAYWKLLTPMATVVEEPKIAPKLQAPTEDAVVSPQPKHNYKDKFNRPPFVGTVKRPVLSRTGRPMFDANNNPMMEEKV